MRFRTLCRLLALVPVGFGLAPLGQALGAAAELGVRHRIDVMVFAGVDPARAFEQAQQPNDEDGPFD